MEKAGKMKHQKDASRRWLRMVIVALIPLSLGYLAFMQSRPAKPVTKFSPEYKITGFGKTREEALESAHRSIDEIVEAFENQTSDIVLGVSVSNETWNELAVTLTFQIKTLHTPESQLFQNPFPLILRSRR